MNMSYLSRRAGLGSHGGHGLVRLTAIAAATLIAVFAAPASAAAEVSPRSTLNYHIQIPAPATHEIEVELTVPADVNGPFELMMPIWSPGYYKVEDYAANVSDVRARTADGHAVAVEHTRYNRWRVASDGPVTVSYRVYGNQRSVTTNYVGADYAVICGAPTFLTLVEPGGTRTHDIHYTLPAGWVAATGLSPIAGQTNGFRATSYDILVDSPLLAGPVGLRTFDVAGKRHTVATVGDASTWEADAATNDLHTFVDEVSRFWGFLPYDQYVFLFMFRPGGGGLEHLNSNLSTVLTSSRPGAPTDRGRWNSLGLAAHEYFHLFNAKRLRPVELGPFDYEKPPTTGSLWLAEGVTSYYSDLLLARAGLRTIDQHLAAMSSLIASLQTAPGRRLQSVEQSSLQVWNNSNSGVAPAATTVSYYTKGTIMGLLLDARIRKATNGRRSLDDVMRLAYERYAGESGYTAEQVRLTAEEVAGTSLQDWFRRSVSSTDELDYAEMLDWFGLRFTTSTGRAGAWMLERRADATAVQKQHLAAWLAAEKGRS